ncbi:unnamed protein product [Prorocentrum cordatum]|uniref:Uncharacterized protein n=1 Tax=Prorocentrum cordatum TaxID=2364126 RepID=A0ABN9T5K9_9DINO|nr:unnamed protein product [Polarella glacialis]
MDVAGNHADCKMLSTLSDDGIVPHASDVLFFTVEHINAAGAKLPQFATSVRRQSLTIQPLSLKLFDPLQERVVVLLESPRMMSVDTLQVLSYDMLQHSDIQSMKSWEFSSTSLEYSKALGVPRSSQKNLLS